MPAVARRLLCCAPAHSSGAPAPQLAGFTLIELMVVVLLVALVTAAVVVGVGNLRGASVQAEAGKVAVAVRYLYNLSVLTGRAHRLVIDVDAGAWWGEEQTSADPCEAFLLPGNEPDKPARKGKGKAGTDEADAPPSDSGFEAAKSQLLQRSDLDKGIRFLGVMTTHQQEPSDRGQAFVYFFPNGTTEHALIWLKEDDVEDADAMTVEVQPLQGTARLHKVKIEADKSFAPAKGDG
ncbi:MAG: type II secretion system protein GspH [Myxococcales bacterium]|nr:type II secretion system protein GspH [Myxococcales bacterium]